MASPSFITSPIGSPTQAFGETLRPEALERAIWELELALREVEAVQDVLDLDAVRIQGAGGAAKGVCDQVVMRPPSFAVAKLAEDVGEELKAWRASREEAGNERHQELLRRLRKAVKNRKEEGRDREAVRQEVRQYLFEQARRALGASNDRYEGEFRPSAGDAAIAAADKESIGAEALAQLKSRLDLAISPVEAMRAECPPGMLEAAELTAEVLSRKRARAPALRAMLLDATGHLDAELLQQADSSASRRKAALAEQSMRQGKIMETLRSLYVERHSMFEDLDAAACAGPPQVDSRVWQALLPAPNAAWQKKYFSGESSPQESVREVEKLAQERIEGLIKEFKEKHDLPVMKPQAAHHEADLDIWKLSAAQDLAQTMKVGARQVHDDLMNSMKEMLGNMGMTPLELLGRAVRSAEDFQRTRQQCLEESCRRAESSMDNFCAANLEKAGSSRRRVELSSLKRWSAAKEQLSNMKLASQMEACQDVAETAQACVEGCHKAMKLPASVKELGSLQSTRATAMLSESWRSLGTSVADRFDFVGEALEALPDTPETCAVARGMLVLIDDELTRQINSLKADIENLRKN